MQGPRSAKPDELPLVIQLVNEVFMEGLDRPHVLGDFFPTLFNKDNLENLRIIVDRDKPVSHVGIWEGDLLIYGSWFKVGMIGCVCTHKKYRGRGYATALMKDAFSKMERDGVDIVFVTGFRNLYRRLNCVEAGRVYNYQISPGKICSKEEKLRIVPYTEDNIQDLIDIYQREPVRYRRTFEEFKLLVERGLNCQDIFLKTFIATEEDEPIAYISIGQIPDEDEIRVFEYAGSAKSVLYLLENSFRFTRIKSVELTVPFQDRELLCLLEKYGYKKPPSEAQVSTVIINPESFLKKVTPYLEERAGKQGSFRIVSAENGKVRLKTKKGETELDLGEFTLLFFGTPENLKDESQQKVEPARNLSLSNVLPLPTPIYGLNYV